MLLSLRGLILRTVQRHAGPSCQVSDAELLERFVASRDEAAFELLLWRHGGMVHHACQNLLRDPHAAEDAFQATFLTLARKASAIRQRESLPGWLHQVACRIALRLRGQTALRRQRERSDPMHLDAAPARPDDDPNLRECRPLLHEELERLPSKYREPIILCFFQGLTHEEAALQLGWPKGTVAGRLARAKELLHRRLAARGIALSGAGVVSLLTVDVAAATVPAQLAQSTLQTVALAVSGQTAAIAGPIFYLSQGVLRTMYWEKAKHLAALILVVAMTGGGATWLVRAQSGGQADPAAPDAPMGRGAQAIGGAADSKADDHTASHLTTQNNLKRIGKAMDAYSQVVRTFPGAIENRTLPGPAIYKDGKPLLSWRVALLPFMDEENLYKQFRLDQPWDSEHNKPLLKKMPDVYRQRGVKDPTTTHLQVFVGQRTIFEGPSGIGYSQIPDGTSNTILVVEAAAPVPWTKPEDLAYAATGKIPDLGGRHPGVFYALFADGNVYALKQRFQPQELRAAITRDEGSNISLKKLIDPAPAFDDPVKLKAEVDKQLGSLRATQGDIQQLTAGLLELQRTAARQRGEGDVEQLKWEYEVIQDELERARAQLTSLKSRIDELRRAKK